MQSPDDHARQLLALDTKVVLLALCTALLTAAGQFFQKLNGVRVGNAFLSGWLILAAICFFPTFVITNKTFLMGGRMSLFIPVTAASYIFAMLIGRFYFGEEVPYNRWFGCALIALGVSVVARG